MRKMLLVAANTARLYLDKRVSRASAALAYFLMMTIFPLLVCLHEMLGSLFPTSEAILDFADGLVPSDTLDILVDYLGYVAQNRSTTMLVMALVTMAMSASAAYRTIDQIMGEIRGKKRYTGPFAIGFSFLFSLLFLAAVYFAAIVMISGNWFLKFVAEHVRFLHIANAWRWARFLLLFGLLFVILLMIYRITSPRHARVHLFTGAILATAALVGVSILFSYFIGISVRYSLIYGSLASVMILLFWLYLCGNILILGNIVNVVLERQT